jgi:prepilin peptidase CpaA
MLATRDVAALSEAELVIARDMGFMSFTAVTYVGLILVASIGCITDLRTGLIPNRLTLPLLLLAPAIHACANGWLGLWESLLGLVICGAIPLIFFCLGATGGGDVKLFAALGAIGGPWLGLEIELISLGLAAVWSLCVMAYRGRLWLSLLNSGKLLLNLALPAKRRWQLDPAEMTSLRIGAAILIATLLAVASRAWLGEPLL